MASNSISALKAFITANGTESFWVGIDVHKRSYHLALLRSDGKSATFVSPASPEQVVQQLSELGVKVSTVAYEAGPTGFTLARLLEARGIHVIVAAPSKIPRSVTAGAKTDRLDCIKLAFYASRGLLRPIAIPTEQEEAHRALLRRRHQLVDSIRRCKQRIKGFLLYHGYEECESVKSWRSDVGERLAELPLQPEGRMTMDSHLRELDFLQQELSQVNAQLDALNKEPRHKQVIGALTSVPGVGKVVATTFHVELFRPQRFSRAEEVASYLGLAPTVRHSGEKTPRGYLMPVGQSRLRSLLIEAAWMWRSKDAWAMEQYNKLLGKTKIPQKAIAALARKLAIILWRLSIEQRAYKAMPT